MTEISAELLAALINDEAKAQRLNELLAQEKKNQAILDQAMTARDAAESFHTEAKKLGVAAQEKHAAAEERHRQLDQRERDLGDMLYQLNSEKDAFNRIRAQVEAEHKQRHDTLTAGEQTMKERTDALLQREWEVGRAMQHAAQLGADLERKHARLHRALVDNGIIEPEEPA